MKFLIMQWTLASGIYFPKWFQYKQGKHCGIVGHKHGVFWGKSKSLFIIKLRARSPTSLSGISMLTINVLSDSERLPPQLPAGNINVLHFESAAAMPAPQLLATSNSISLYTTGCCYPPTLATLLDIPVHLSSASHVVATQCIKACRQEVQLFGPNNRMVKKIVTLTME